MWSYSTSIVTTVDKKILWQVLTDVNHWNKWLIPVCSSQLKGQFDQNAKITVCLENKVNLDFQFEKLDPMNEFKLHAELLLSQMYLTVLLEENEKESKDDHSLIVKVQVEFSGLAWPFFSYMLGTLFKKQLSKSLDKLVEISKSV